MSLQLSNQTVAAGPGGAVLDTLAGHRMKQLLEEYRAGLSQIVPAHAGENPVVLVKTLRIRDEIAARVQSDTTVEPADLLVLSELDAKLSSVAPSLEAAIGVPALKRLASATQSSDQGWWWRLDEALPSPSWMWTAATALAFTVALSLIAEIARRFFSGGPDLTGVVYILVQAGLALFAGGALLSPKLGGKGLEARLDAWGLRRAFHPAVRLWLGILAAAFSILGYVLLPTVAGWYNSAGVRNDRSGDVSQAIQDFKRALSLSPRFPQAHYSLGRAYERTLDYENAAAEYQKAIELEKDLYLAYNSLARLYIVHKDDAPSALDLIDRGLKLVSGTDAQKDDDVKRATFSLLKNRGWANLTLKNYAQARVDLDAALGLFPNRASAHCLLALLDEANGAKDSESWDLCLGYSGEAPDVEAAWGAMAQDRIERREVEK